MEEDLEYVIRHVFLPPKLPQGDDSSSRNDRLLTQLVKDALESAAALSSVQCPWTSMSTILNVMLDENRDGAMSTSALSRTLVSLKDNEAIVLHIRSQNAGLIVRRSDHEYSFEAFELSPRTEAVIAAKGRLRCVYPGPAIGLSESRVLDRAFREALVELISQLDSQDLAEACHTTKKAGHDVVEIRQTINPKYVTEMLMGILRGIGYPQLSGERIEKRVRDEVLWDNALLPWRRSPRYLLLRIALQTSLVTKSGDVQVHIQYKSFMLLLMARILERALKSSTPSDLLFIMTAKISRRMIKLGKSAEDMPWSGLVQDTVSAVQQELTKRWNTIQDNPDPLGCSPATILIELRSDFDDTCLSLRAMRKYYKEMNERNLKSSDPPHRISTCAERIKQDASILPSAQILEVLAKTSSIIWLVDFEMWVKDSLQTWLIADLQQPSKKSCSALEAATTIYHKAARKAYADDPERFSFMVITLMDMWVALDKCATSLEPLLLAYNTGFPSSLFDPLLVPKKTEMVRLFQIEEYLERRRRGATPGNPSIFVEANKANSFAVQYFEQSDVHQRLRREIESAANSDRDKKRAELEEKKNQYRSLIQQSNAIASCQYVRVRRGKRQNIQEVTEHSPQCERCRLQRRAHAMKIDIHEWPLPANDLEAKAAVFEINVPEIISVWRETTYEILVDVFTPDFKTPEEQVDKYTLYGFSGLRRWIKYRPGRLQMASQKKEFSRAHYKSQDISVAVEQSICVNNGLRCNYYDAQCYMWTTKTLGMHSVASKCILKLPSGSYKTLQWALNSTSHTSNEILARQDRCPDSLTLHEFYSFASLRSGHRLQWRNIAREIVSRILNFSHKETSLLMLQAAWEVGPSQGSYFRESHVDLEEEDFGLFLLDALDGAVSDFESNWQGASAIRTFTFLATRLLSLSPHQSVESRSFRLLERVRIISLCWTREVIQLMHDTEAKDDLKALGVRALDLALTCYETFDVELHHLSAMLAMGENASILIECLITIRDRCPPSSEDLTRNLSTLLERFFRRCIFTETTLRAHILSTPTSIDHALSELWGAYKPGSGWTALQAPNSRWLTTQIFIKGDGSAIDVHLNLLSGSLLVAGSPLSRLPEDFESHETYRRLFGDRVLEVVPSTSTEMTFESRRLIHGQTVHFRLFNGELIIRTYKDGSMHELIPLRAVEGDFPRSFVVDYTHWLDSAYGTIEWRPLTNPWVASTSNWRTWPHGDQKFSLGRSPMKLIDIHSPIAESISKILSPIEYPEHVHIMFNFDSSRIEVHLPRLNLDFYVLEKSSLLQSKQFRGMAVDTNQSFGSFSGLRNKLVLRESDGTLRMVIVPDGDIFFGQETSEDHVRVSITTVPLKQVFYHQFQIDNQLGRLVDNGSLRSRLFRIYLHALTSYCLPDRLTGRTGTEEALYGLSLASTRSFLTLGGKEVDLLIEIERLSPKRKYYPKHLETMQTVAWKRLSPLSQHERFFQEVESIVRQADSLEFSRGPGSSGVSLAIGPPRRFIELYERAIIRNSGIRTHGFGAEDFTVHYDKPYGFRKHVPELPRELRTCTIARMVDDWSPNTKVRLNLLHEIESWKSPVVGNAFHGNVFLGFDTEWLKPPAKIFPVYWGALCRKLSATDPSRDKYRVMIFLSTLAYSVNANIDLVKILLGFATMPELRQMTMPDYDNFLKVPGYSPNKQELRRTFNRYARPFKDCPESRIDSLPHAHRQQYNAAIEARVMVCAEYLINQWPIRDASILAHDDLITYIDLTGAMVEVRNLFRQWYCNYEFEDYVRRIQALVNHSSEYPSADKYSVVVPTLSYHPSKCYITFEDLLSKRAPAPGNHKKIAHDVQSLVVYAALSASSEISVPSSTHDKDKLAHLLRHLAQRASGPYEKAYVADLENSHSAFRQSTIQPSIAMEGVQPLLQRHLMETQGHVNEMYEAIISDLQFPVNSAYNLCCTALMLPRLSPSILLSYLAQSLRTILSDDWKAVIVEFGVAITSLQRAERLIACAGNRAELLSELSNPGHLEWSPLEYPDWLLLELENNILIRGEQAQIARQMIQPMSGQNSIMQLNMGLGKSSVIVPIVAATLADEKRLARVVVLKSLATQMFQLLLKKLGGLINRRVFFLPISRSLPLNIQVASQIRNIYEECMKIGGVFLVQPEHLLSFELLGLDRALASPSSDQLTSTRQTPDDGPIQSSNVDVGKIMVETQRWLLKYSRDILDESDEILSVRFELIYTMGSQRATEFSPDRWIIIERILGIFANAAKEMVSTGLFPNGLEVLPAKPGTFPRIRILKPDVGSELLSRVARDVCENGFPGLSVWNLPPQARAVLFRFITDPAVSELEIQPLQDSALGIKSIKLGLLLLRGLFAGGILIFAFAQKRWRVNYGLDLSRTKLSVPYYAKDSPAARAEFSHPDTAIILTCLSYYYGGLSDKQLHACFEHLFQSDHAQEEYEEWTRNNPELPNAFRQLSGVNLTNEAQCSRDLFPFLKFSKAVIDFYMSCLVFPKEMKEFSHKLSSSGWEIGRDKVHPMTGFSGTNDSKYILPAAVKQRDLPQQLHTNAAVLDCLLRPENAVDSLFTSGVEVLDALVLLQMAIKSNPPIRVILDVGAQVLELRNEDVAQKWLALVLPSEAQAAIYFDDHNDLYVLSRTGLKEPLLVSPYAKQMDRCLIYLDEAHTRGTDLKMPSDYRAIVTLGPDLTKDRLAQACMRMRKLGKGQSVVFCGSVEVQLKILQSNGKSFGDSIVVADVLSWCIQNTWNHTRKSIPLWATQGVRHYRRRAACSTSSGLPATPESILEEEAQSLEQRYGFALQQSEERAIFQNDGHDQLLVFNDEIEAIRQKCREFGLNTFNDSSLHEEQERELQPENEREQQVERPPPLDPRHPTIQPSVVELITDGLLNRFSAAFQPAFWTFTKTSASTSFESSAWPQDLLVTSDFANTVRQSDNESLDQYLRPVHWIVSVQCRNTISCVIISPHEANELMPLVRGNRKVTLHVYAPRLSLSNPSLEDLAFCAIPAVSNTWVAPNLAPQINLFAGQLYLRDIWEYLALCRFLGLSYKPPPEGVTVAVDGFVNTADRWIIDHGMARHCRFSKSPVTFLRIITGLRRKGQNFNGSHIGRVLNGELLKEDHFVIQGRPTAPARITDGNEMFQVNEVINVIELENEAPEAAEKVEKVEKVEEVEEVEEVEKAEETEGVEMVGGRGWLMDENGVIVLDD